ncbi:MMPL family transporter [SAR202 cluster bacterium AD-804-J14_MRT_500m]|nr:MMPL family transporter [SAR202 cluster bacterium AD-804-J14_MRT_500m]
MLYRIGQLTYRLRWVIIVVWAGLFVLSLNFALKVPSLLQSGFGDMDTESRQALKLLADKLNITESGFIIVFSSLDMTIDDPRYIHEMESVMAPLNKLPEIIRMDTFYDGGTNEMISPDRRTVYAVVSMRGTIDEAIQSVPKIENFIQSDLLDIWITGGVPIFSDINNASENDLRRGEIIAIPLVLTALIFVFRGLVPAAVPVAMGVVSVTCSLAILYFVAQHTGVSIFALNLVSFLGLGVAIDYSLLIVSRYRDKLKLCSGEEAIAQTIGTAGEVIIFSGLTSILGLGSLVLFDLMMLRSLGIGGVLVISTSLIVSMTLVPAVLCIVSGRFKSVSGRDQPTLSSRYWKVLTTLVMRRPIWVAVPIICLLVVLGIPFLNINLGSPWASMLPVDAPSRQGWDVVSQEIGIGELTPVVIAAQFDGNPTSQTNILSFAEIVKNLENHHTVKRVESILSPDKSFQTIKQNYAGTDTTMIRVFSHYDPLDHRSKDLVQDIRNLNLDPNFQLLVTGATADLMDSVDAMYKDFPKAVGFVIATVYFALFVLFRSVILPFKAVILNMMSIFASYGALVYIFQEGHLQNIFQFTSEGVTEATVPILLFAIIFGLSMDYEIFLLSRIKEFYQATQDNAVSVARGMQDTGPLITNAALILVLVAVSFASSDIVIIKALAVGTAIAVFLDATIVRTLLVPALMRIMDRWNWWAPSFIIRLFPKI